VEESDIDLSLCTVAGRQPQALRGMLRSVYETADPVGFECLVAETGESGAAALVDEFPGLLVVGLAGLSRAAAHNHLLRLCRGRYAALVDPDLLVQPGCLHQLVVFMDDNPEVGLVAPRIIDAYGRTEPSCRAFPRLLRASGLPLLFPPPRLRTRTEEVDWCLGGFHLLRPELTEEIGLLDEACAGLAELDLYWRARRKGWHRTYLFEAVAIHANPGRYHARLARGPAWPERLRVGLRFLKKHLLDRGQAI